MPRGARFEKDARRKELALESLFVYCDRTKRTRRPRRESSEFNVVEQVMIWWLGQEEWTSSSIQQQEKQLRSVTQWWNHRKRKGNRHHFVDPEELEVRVSILFQLNKTKGFALESPQFRGTAQNWAKLLGIAPPKHDETNIIENNNICDEHTPNCGHTPVKILSEQGVASIGFVVNRAPCCESSGNLFCDVHNGRTEGTLHEHCMVSHGDHIDYVIRGCLTHPTEVEDGSMQWHQCGELVEMHDDTLNDLFNLFA
mmetsp:Transcript_19945/g.25813  ORF Transcript_19945/g.25813 Transcript_19945/m.25813 type:complete len:255 (+) Transcript_19945:328-1092(+)